MCVALHAQSIQNKKFAYLSYISRKTWGMKLFFVCRLTQKFSAGFLLWVCVSRHAQSTQSNKFATSLQYLKKTLKDGVDFLPADKHQRLFQVDTITVGMCDQACPNYPK